MSEGRGEILNWINDTLQLNYTKIEHMCTGAAHCQLIDIIFPGKIALSKVNYQAKYDYEYIKNFSYLQESFAKIGVEKAVEVAEMVKGKPQANLEFCQFMKRFFDQHYSGDPYNALERRIQLKILADSDKALMASLGIKASTAPRPSIAKPTATTTTAKPTATTSSIAKTAPKPTTTTTTTAKPVATTKPVAAVTKPIAKPALSTTATAKKPAAVGTTIAKPSTSVVKPTTSAIAKPSTGVKNPSPTPDLSAVVASLKKQLEEKNSMIEEMNNDINNLKENIQEIEKDRDYYFDTLRSVEVYCQNNEVEHSILSNVLNILYSKSPEEGAQEGEEEQQIVDEELQEEVQEEEQEILENEEDQEILENEEIVEEIVEEDDILEKDYGNDENLLNEEF